MRKGLERNINQYSLPHHTGETTMKYKTIHELKAGDVVYAHGGTFKILYDAKPSLSHHTRVHTGRGFTVLPEAPDCAYTEGECLTGEVKGYFSKGTKWTFQGNFKACKVTVE